MIQYADRDTENDPILPMVRWNENGFTIPIFDEPSNSNDQAGVYSTLADENSIHFCNIYIFQLPQRIRG